MLAIFQVVALEAENKDEVLKGLENLGGGLSNKEVIATSKVS